MESAGDPILDAQALCKEAPLSPEDLTKKLLELGWHPKVIPSALTAAEGVYLVLGEDGLIHPREGTVDEIFQKALAMGKKGA